MMRRVDFAVILALLVSGLVVGLLARLAIPGPDPMSIWMTVGFGIAGALLGGGAGYAVAAEPGAFLASVVVASVLIVGYRRFVQRRPITGPEARRLPRR